MSSLGPCPLFIIEINAGIAPLRHRAKNPIKGAGLPPAAGSGGIPAALVLSPVDMWKSALAGRTRLKGVDKPVDGQRAARPPVCPPRAAFPHTHRRKRKFKKKAQEPKSDESNVVLDHFLGGSVPLLRREKKEEFSDDAGYSQNCSLVQ